MNYKHEIVIPNEDLTFRMFPFEGAEGKYRVAKHWHRSVEIYVVQEGELNFYINGILYPLSAKNRPFILVNSNELHEIEAPNPNRTIVLQIPLKNFHGFLGVDDYIYFMRARTDNDRRIVALIERMFDTYEKKEYGYALAVNGFFSLMLYELVTQYRMDEPNKELLRQNRNLNRLSDITDYIRSNYNQDLSLELVASHFGFSSAYLSRMFRKYASMNYKNFLQNLRLEYAVMELVETDHYIGDIALNHGFPNSKAFTNAFRARFGVLPGEYRKNLARMGESLRVQSREKKEQAEI
ncbi:MAG: AraC family transcriptional regulator [bacterium]|nr:AraC family transcriptional regulator [bacterium]